jgi:acyl-coenzyme A thioesterase PaaI-like protein
MLGHRRFNDTSSSTAAPCSARPSAGLVTTPLLISRIGALRRGVQQCKASPQHLGRWEQSWDCRLMCSASMVCRVRGVKQAALGATPKTRGG